MSAQHTQKTAFVAGTLQDTYTFPVREIESLKRHFLEVRLVRREDGSLVVSPKRLSTTGARHLGVEMTGWCTGRDIPHASLFESLPRPWFRNSQVNTWRAVQAHFWKELVAAERGRLLQAPLPHEPIRPMHLQVRETYEGLLSVPTSDGPLEVERMLSNYDDEVQGTVFTLKNVPISHPLVGLFVRSLRDESRNKRPITAMFDTYGAPLWPDLETGSVEERFTRLLRDCMVPTGRREAPYRDNLKEVHHGTEV